MKDLRTLQNETPLARRMLMRLAKKALCKIPVIGAAFELLDEVVLGSIAAQEQERVNSLVGLMYERLEPLLRKLETEELPDEALENRLAQPEVAADLEKFAAEVRSRQADFQKIVDRLAAQVGKHEEKIETITSEIETLTSEVAKLGQSLDIGAQFKYIAQSVKHRLSIQGNVQDLYDNLAKPSGSGGQGLLYRAHRLGTAQGRTVVVKTLKAKRSGDVKAIQRFLLEGFLSSQIVHPNIVRVTDYGGFYAADEYFIEMEDLGNTTLKDWYMQNPFTGENLEAYLDLMLQAIAAFDAIHAQNLVHRDVKPSNFMVLEGRLKLIDFGSVKSLEAEENLKAGRTMTATGEMVGTPQYMSPEQFDRGFARIGAKTDVYGLGVTLFEICTGRLPFTASSAIQYGKYHTEVSPGRPSSVNPKIPGWLDTLILNMLAKRPEDRAGLDAVWCVLEQNRPKTLDTRMAEVNRQIMDSFRHGLSEEAEKDIRDTLAGLESQLAGVSPALQKRLQEFIGQSEKDLAGLRRQVTASVSRAFNPLLCPNMRCETPLEPGVNQCPACQTEWLIPCVCERKEKTAYMKDKCQKCRERRPIPMEHRQKYSLLVTLSHCLQAKEYVKALTYLGFFPQLEKDPDVAKLAAEAQRLKAKEEASEIEKTASRLKTGVTRLKDEKAKEDEAQRQDRLRREEDERQSEVARLEKMLAAGDLNDAFDSYRDNFPAYLKNDKTQAVFEKICDELIRPDVEKAKEFQAQKEYKEAIQALHSISVEYRTACLEEFIAKIFLEAGSEYAARGDFATAIRIWEGGARATRRTTELASSAASLKKKWQGLQGLTAKAQECLANGNLDKAKEALQSELFFEAIPKEIEEAYLQLATQVEIASQKSNLGGKLAHWMAGKTKEAEIAASVSATYRQTRANWQRQREEERRRAEEERKRREEGERMAKELEQKIPQVRKILSSGFTFLREAKYTCGELTNTVQEFQHDVTGMEFVYIPGGTFQMGGNKSDNEQPIHKVTLTPYLMAKYACTQAEWKKIMGSDPSKFKGDRRPVEQVSWNDCQEFCKKTGLALPSEAQWEFACRAGSTGEYCFGDDESLLEQYAWYDKNSGSETHPVGQKKPNALGLYDMHGNVWEWCQDGWHENYNGAPNDGSTWETGTSGGSQRVKRGGSWGFGAWGLRSAHRYGIDAEGRDFYLGARLVSEAH
jgi:formylglycine-generating enzyme required for sulfatase activity/serine/threonine protein kinase